MSMKKILLNDLLGISADEIWNVRVKFNMYNGNTDPLDEYLSDPEIVNTGWFLYHGGNRRNYHEGALAICLLKLDDDRWLLTTIKRVTKLLDVSDGVGYIADELEEYRQYYGRVIVGFHNNAMQIVRRYDSVLNDLEILEILPAMYDGEEFQGYDNVRLSFTQLERIIRRQKSSWIAALRNQKAVYLITDKNNGKLYVGSATASSKMLLQRWSDYVSTYHGGNVELISLVKKEGSDYVRQHFQYSILENYNAKVDDNYILQREKWWKKVLCSKEWGYNGNL